jgi:hypothetical protein
MEVTDIDGGNFLETLSLTTFSRMTLSIKGLFLTFSVTTLSIAALFHYAKCHAECNFFIVMLNVNMLRVNMLRVIMLSVNMLSVIMLSVVILRAVLLSVIMLSVVMLNVVAPFVMVQARSAQGGAVFRFKSGKFCKSLLFTFLCRKVSQEYLKR